MQLTDQLLELRALATRRHVARAESALDREGAVTRVGKTRDGTRSYLALEIGDAASAFTVGVRKLGLANLKGLDRMAVYEIVDGERWHEQPLEEIAPGKLLAGLDRDFATSKTTSIPTR